MKQSGDQAPENYGGGTSPSGRRLLTVTEIFGDGNLTALTKAMWRLDDEEARELIASGTDINGRGRRDVTPLLFLLANQQVEAVQLALSLGADPSLASDAGDTPLEVAVYADRWDELLKLIVNAGADVEKASELNRLRRCNTIEHRVLQRVTPLVRERPCVEPLWWLLEHGGDVNAQDCHGRTLLHTAYLRRHFDVVYGLLERGANPHIQISGEPFLEWVRSSQMLPPTDEERPWVEKVHEKVKELNGNQEMLREARERDIAFAEFRERYEDTQHSAFEQRQRQDIQAIINALEQQVEKAED